MTRVMNAPTAGIPYARLDTPVEKALGAWVQTASGRRYIDLGNMYGSVILGHGDPDVSNAVTEAIGRGVQSCGGHAIAAEVADVVQRLEGHGEHGLAVFKTGSTAVLAAAEMCRQASGRPYVASCGYHGWGASWEVDRGLFELSSRGVFDCFFVPEALERFLRAEAARTACFVLSPDYVHLETATLRDLISVAQTHGVAVVADEVKWGFRRGAGSSLLQAGLTADLFVYSKAIGNGWPLALVVGEADLLAAGSASSSTLTFEATSLAATHRTLLRLADEGVYARIRDEGGRLLEGFRRRISETGFRGVEVVGDGHLFQFVFSAPDLEEAFFAAAQEGGLLLFQGDNQTPSLALEGEVVDEAVSRLTRTLEVVAGSHRSALTTPVDTLRRVHAAWNQMDGLAYHNHHLEDATRVLTDLLSAA